MTWIAVLLVAVALTDLTHSVWPIRHLAGAVGAAAAVVTGLVSGLTSSRDLAALLAIAGVAVLWDQTVTRAFAGRRPWLPLLVLGVALTGAVLVSPAAGPVDGAVATWLGRAELPVLDGVTPDRFLLLVGAYLLQLSTGNVLVRLVLAATGTVNPLRHGGPGDPETRLKGGRLLGPMERIFILSLGLAGQVTAASIVVAAKGLLRFPELQSKRDQARIHQLTEYFLVGSFASWLVALSALVLLAD